MFELNHPFFAPLWRRVAIVVLPLGWALFELANGEAFWAVLFFGAACYAAWGFFLASDRPRFEKELPPDLPSPQDDPPPSS